MTGVFKVIRGLVSSLRVQFLFILIQFRTAAAAAVTAALTAVVRLLLLHHLRTFWHATQGLKHSHTPCV